MIAPEPRRNLTLLAGGALLSLALWAFHREMLSYPPGEVIRQIRSLPAWGLLAALALTATDYVLLTGYDVLALRALNRPLPYRRTALASFCGYAASHNLGMALLSGGGVRFRLYSAFGLTPLEIAGVVGFCGLTYWMGLAALGGLYLLAAGAIPLPHPLNRPLALVEASHFLSSLAGMGLLLVAEGLRRRVDGAWLLSVTLLGAGAVLGVLKGDGPLGAAIPLVGALLLLPQRVRFDRRCALWGDPLSPGWTAAVVLGFGASLWLGFFAFRHVEYRDALWWAFALQGDGDASRFLRASVGAAVLALGWAGLRLLRPACPPPEPATEEDLAAAEPVVAASPKAEAHLVFLGDKRLLFSPDRRAFIQYGVQGRTWVAFGDPVGPRECWEELAWTFRERAHRCGARGIFYEVGESALGLCLDLGLRPRKIGEEARVPLDRFSLEGSSGKRFRAVLRRLEEREGISFRVVPASEVPSLLPTLREISDQWLEAKHTREKGFSLGRFDEPYLRRFPVALAERDGGIQAFANLWTTQGREELSPDLMRHRSDAPREIMEYLFVRLLAWGKEEGYGAFSLGMAPLSGLQDRSLAPLEQRLGARLFAHGEHFYNFQGLRRFKEKFDPQWSPRYLAAPGGLALPGILADLAALISGGWTGIVGK